MKMHSDNLANKLTHDRKCKIYFASSAFKFHANNWCICLLLGSQYSVWIAYEFELRGRIFFPFQFNSMHCFDRLCVFIWHSRANPSQFQHSISVFVVVSGKRYSFISRLNSNQASSNLLWMKAHSYLLSQVNFVKHI
jgi:hypothetical protein